jgi:hypothetical protein
MGAARARTATITCSCGAPLSSGRTSPRGKVRVRRGASFRSPRPAISRRNTFSADTAFFFNESISSPRRRRRFFPKNDLRRAVPRKAPADKVHQRDVPPERVHRRHALHGHHPRRVVADSQRVHAVDVHPVVTHGTSFPPNTFRGLIAHTRPASWTMTTRRAHSLGLLPRLFT